MRKLIALVLLLAAAGCASKSKVLPVDRVGNPTPRIESISDDITRATTDLNGALDEGRKRAPELADVWARISLAMNTIAVKNQELLKVSSQVAVMQGQIDALRAEVEKLKSQPAQDLARRFNVLIISGILTIAGSIVLLYAAKNMPVAGKLWRGIAVGGVFAAASIIGLCLFIRAAEPWLKWFVLAYALLGTAYLVWYLYTERKSTRELTKLVTVTRRELSPDADHRLFTAPDAAVGALLSPTTQKMVEQSRDEPETPPSSTGT